MKEIVVHISGKLILMYESQMLPQAYRMEVFVVVVIWKLFTIAASQDCSFNYTAKTGRIETPNYPSNYANDLDCTYTIRSPTRNPITLIFVNFNVIRHPDCSEDYVQISDGDENEKIIGKYCGSITPYPIIALTGILNVFFHTNYQWVGRGFQAYYNDSTDRVRIYRQSSQGTFESPNYPDVYPNNAMFLYLIQGLEKYPLDVTFLHFDVDETFDNLTILNGMGNSATQLGTFSGKTLPTVEVIDSGTLFMIFRSDNGIARSGFKAKYQEKDYIRIMIVEIIAFSLCGIMVLILFTWFGYIFVLVVKRRYPTFNLRNICSNVGSETTGNAHNDTNIPVAAGIHLQNIRRKYIDATYDTPMKTRDVTKIKKDNIAFEDSSDFVAIETDDKIKENNDGNAQVYKSGPRHDNTSEVNKSDRASTNQDGSSDFIGFTNE